jgi:hypothetical protein
MLNTYIKNRGSTKTILHTNNKNKVNEISWDADYDGENANISIDLNDDNGKQTKHYDIQLDNKNLAEILNIPSVNMPLEKRLMLDFKKSRKNVQEHRRPMVIEFDMDNMNNMDKPFSSPISREKILESMMVPYLESPLSNQEFIIPKKTMRLMKVYKKPRSYTRHKKHRTSSRKTRTTPKSSLSSKRTRSRRTL